MNYLDLEGVKKIVNKIKENVHNCNWNYVKEIDGKEAIEKRNVVIGPVGTKDPSIDDGTYTQDNLVKGHYCVVEGLCNRVVGDRVIVTGAQNIILTPSYSDADSDSLTLWIKGKDNSVISEMRNKGVDLTEIMGYCNSIYMKDGSGISGSFIQGEMNRIESTQEQCRNFTGTINGALNLIKDWEEDCFFNVIQGINSFFKPEFGYVFGIGPLSITESEKFGPIPTGVGAKNALAIYNNIANGEDTKNGNIYLIGVGGYDGTDIKNDTLSLQEKLQVLEKQQEVQILQDKLTSLETGVQSLFEKLKEVDILQDKLTSLETDGLTLTIRCLEDLPNGGMGLAINGIKELVPIKAGENKIITKVQKVFIFTDKNIDKFEFKKGSIFSSNSLKSLYFACNFTGLLDLSMLNLDNLEFFSTDLPGAFFISANCSIRLPKKWKPSGITALSNAFYMPELTSLDLSGLDLSNISDLTNFIGCPKLIDFQVGEGIGKMKDEASTLDLSTLTKWTNSTVQTLLDLYDRKANGMGVITIKLSAATKSALGTNGIQTLTAKGYTIA